MQQLSFTDMEYANRKVITPKEKFLNAMDKIIPWEEWVGIIKQYYYEGKRGRKPKDRHRDYAAHVVASVV